MPSSAYDEEALTEFARQRIDALNEAAWEVYHNEDYKSAGKLWLQALEITMSIGDLELEMTIRCWYGAALEQMARLRETIETLTPVLQARGLEDRKIAYIAMTRYLVAAIDLPLEVAVIERAHAQIEAFLVSAGHGEWRHRLLLTEAGLRREQGNHHRALFLAQESWSVWREDGVGFTSDCHLEELCRIAFELRDAELLERTLRIWQERQHNQRWTAIYRSKLARLRGDAGAALSEARRALALGIPVVNPEDAEITDILHCFLLSGHVSQIRDLFESMLALGQSESGLIRYGVSVCQGDYFLAEARVAAGIPSADDELASEGSPAFDARNTEAAHAALTRARHAYLESLSQGRLIDRKLGSYHRQRTVVERLKRLGHIAGAVRGRV